MKQQYKSATERNSQLILSIENLNNLVVYGQNINGMKSKAQDIKEKSSKSVVYMFTETNLDDTVYDSEIFPDDFTVFRTDRNGYNNGKKRNQAVAY